MAITVAQIQAAECEVKIAREQNREAQDRRIRADREYWEAQRLSKSREKILHNMRARLTALTEQRHRELFEESQRLVAPDA